jgi:hypothetical protein
MEDDLKKNERQPLKKEEKRMDDDLKKWETTLKNQNGR